MSASCVTQLDPTLVTLHREWSAILATMHTYLHGASETDTRDYTATIKASTQRRMLDFNSLSIKLRDQNVSRADMIFVLQCYAINCRFPTARTSAILTDVNEISAQLCITGSRHTAYSRQRSIDVDDTSPLLHQTASWLVQFGSTDSSILTRALDAIGKLTTSPSTTTHMKALMALPHTGVPIKDSVRMDESDSNSLRVFALQDNDVEMEPDIAEEEDIETSEQKGDYWLVETPIILKAILSFASRIFHQVSLEQHTFALFSIASDDPYVYPPVALTNLRSLVMARCATTAGDSFVPKFREAVHRWCLPMGTLSLRYRSNITQFQQSSAANMMEQELGMDTSQALYNIINVPLTSIASNDNHELYDILTFFTLSTLIENRCGADFASCVLMSYDLTARHSILQKTVESHEARRPLIVSIMQKTWIHDQGMWYRCNSLIDASLKWLIMMKYAYKLTDVSTKAPRYNNKLKEKSLNRVSDSIIGDNLHTLLPSWN